MQVIQREQDWLTLSKEVAQRASPLASLIDEEDAIPEEIRSLMWEKGLLNLLPLSGGDGLRTAIICSVVEELSKVSAALGLLVIVQAVGTLPILLAGSPEQKSFFEKEIALRKFVAFALTEPKSGSDAQSIRTEAAREGNHYVLNGSKIFVTNGELSDFFVVFARTGENHKESAISAFMVPRDAQGLEVGPKSDLMGMRGVPTTFLTLRNVRVGREHLLGEEGKGFKVAMKTLDISRPYIGAQAVGIAAGALEFALQFARKRVLFGQPISQQQGIQFMLSDMATGIEAARQLVYHAARAMDSRDPLATRYSAMSKYFASDMAMKVTADAFQVLGGYGCLRGNPVERMMRDAKITQIFEGTNQIQRIVVSRSLLRDHLNGGTQRGGIKAGETDG